MNLSHLTHRPQTRETEALTRLGLELVAVEDAMRDAARILTPIGLSMLRRLGARREAIKAAIGPLAKERAARIARRVMEEAMHP